VDLDPNYALAWAGLADCYTTLCWYGLAVPKDFMPKAIEAARRAVALDASLAEGHGALAMASILGLWDRVEAEREFVRAIQLNPKYVQALDWYGLFLQLSEGRLMEGIEQAKLALASDPLSGYAHAVYGLTCVYAGKTTEAVVAGRRAVELDSESFLTHWSLQVALWLSGQFEESVATGELALALSGRFPWAMGVLALTLADWGKTSEADAVYCEMEARARRQHVPPALLAVAASAAGREDEAIRHAFQAYEIRDPSCQSFFSRYFPLASRLYRYSRFREIIAQMGRADWLPESIEGTSAS
jgi:tetratricopeptide (TPR) repeat protein